MPEVRTEDARRFLAFEVAVDPLDGGTAHFEESDDLHDASVDDPASRWVRPARAFGGNCGTFVPVQLLAFGDVGDNRQFGDDSRVPRLLSHGARQRCITWPRGAQFWHPFQTRHRVLCYLTKLLLVKGARSRAH